jgi:hypothetical protein
MLRRTSKLNNFPENGTPGKGVVKVLEWKMFSAGNLAFIGIHVLIVAGWIAVNTQQYANTRRFDPAPFSLLGTILAFEAILLASSFSCGKLA